MKARCIYKLAEGVPYTTYNLIMATQELGGAVVEAESTKGEPPQKSGHNNPKEVQGASACNLVELGVSFGYYFFCLYLACGECCESVP